MIRHLMTDNQRSKQKIQLSIFFFLEGPFILFSEYNCVCLMCFINCIENFSVHFRSILLCTEISELLLISSKISVDT